MALTNAYFTQLLQVHVYLSTANMHMQLYTGYNKLYVTKEMPGLLDSQLNINYKSRCSQITCICTHILQCYLLPSRSCTVPPSNRFFSSPSSSPSFCCTASADVQHSCCTVIKDFAVLHLDCIQATSFRLRGLQLFTLSCDRLSPKEENKKDFQSVRSTLVYADRTVRG